MTLGEFLSKVKELPPETVLCVAELEEAFGLNVATVEILDNARVLNDAADGREAIELANGDRRALVLRT
ncbi:MAG: sugar phosphorylase [Pararhizobium sp.]